MPISNNASYIPTINQFVAHWGQVNAALPAPLVVERNLAQFTALRTQITAQAAGVINALNVQEVARGDIDIKKAQLLGWLNEFNGLLDAYWAGTPFANARPMAPGLSLGEEKFSSPMRDVASLWVLLNGANAPTGVTLPLALSDGMLQADFEAAIAALHAAYIAEATAAQAVVLARAQREVSKRAAYDTMKAYRLAVPSRCRQFPALVETLPALTPAAGHTPEPVDASAVFQAPDEAKVVHSASEDAELDHYELRGNPGEAYNDDDAVTIDSHLPADPLEFVTGFGLTQPGARAAFKVYVVLNTGNEAGSASMLVQRP